MIVQPDFFRGNRELPNVIVRDGVSPEQKTIQTTKNLDLNYFIAQYEFDYLKRLLGEYFATEYVKIDWTDADIPSDWKIFRKSILHVIKSPSGQPLAYDSVLIDYIYKHILVNAYTDITMGGEVSAVDNLRTVVGKMQKIKTANIDIAKKTANFILLLANSRQFNSDFIDMMEFDSDEYVYLTTIIF